MVMERNHTEEKNGRSHLVVFGILVGLGFVVFLWQVASHPNKAWLVYLTNFLLFSALAQGGLLFSALMHMTRAKWSRKLSGVAESFTAFFPVSILLFILLFTGSDHVFPWIGENLHGKEVWLNVPFVFLRDIAGLLLLYGLGLGYLYHSLWYRLDHDASRGVLKSYLFKRWEASPPDPELFQRRMTLFAGFYLFFFAVVLSLIGYDLVMAMDPHWYSTLFGAYSFVKAIYIGLGAIIILAAVLHLNSGTSFRLPDKDFHDIGKLFLGFCLVWGDFFYAQLVVIWYGNIPEETAYLIERTMTPPWNTLAWTVLFVCFVLPFLILINRKVKTIPIFMIILCSCVISGMWLEHFLLMGPAFLHDLKTLPIAVWDFVITAGFFGLMAGAINYYFKEFPELLSGSEEGGE